MGKAWKPQSQNRCEKQTEATTFPFWQLRSAIERKCPPNCILKESAKMRGLSIHEYTQSTTAALVACSCSPYVSWMPQQGDWLKLVLQINKHVYNPDILAYMPHFTLCDLEKLSSFYINQSMSIKDQGVRAQSVHSTLCLVKTRQWYIIIRAKMWSKCYPHWAQIQQIVSQMSQ